MTAVRAGGCGLPSCPRPVLCPGWTTDQSPPADKQTTPCCALEVPDGAVPTAANKERLLARGGWGGAHRRPPRADVGFLSRCVGWPSPWLQSSSVALVKAKRHQSARSFLGQGATEDVQGPEHTRDGPDLAPSAQQQPSSTLADPRGSEQARPLSPGQSQCHVEVSEARAGRGPTTVWGQRGPELPDLGNLVHPSSLVSCRRVWRACLVGAGLCSARMARASAATAVHWHKSQALRLLPRRDCGSRLHAPPCTPAGTPWGEGSGS